MENTVVSEIPGIKSNTRNHGFIIDPEIKFPEIYKEFEGLIKNWQDPEDINKFCQDIFVRRKE